MGILFTSGTQVGPAPPGELCNLLQVAASALHQLDLALDDTRGRWCGLG